jgi:hypothetical protein
MSDTPSPAPDTSEARAERIRAWQARMGPGYMAPDVVAAQIALAWAIGDTMPMPRPKPATYNATSPTMIGQTLRSAAVIMQTQQLMVEDLQRQIAALTPSRS